MDLVQISTTTGDAALAQAIADHLVERRLAACVQVIGPINSTYRWQGSVERAEEFMCLIKTHRELGDDVGAAIRSLHTYDNPEVIVSPIEGGSVDYLQWIWSETGG